MENGFQVSALRVPKKPSADDLHVKYDGFDDEHFASRFSMVIRYRIENRTKKTCYFVHLWESKESQTMICSCDCPARGNCKHLFQVVRVHKQAVEAGFYISPFKDDEVLQ